MRRRRSVPVQLGPIVKLIELPTNRDAEGEPRVAVHIIPPATAIDRRPLLRVFGSLAGALALKRSLEGSR
ncbi:hypothetical protein EBE87_25925 [Pseudoroseomonas wenyumeiae]|uniref:Uncharacterized protein n=1 Tax=Teichococcus wenyumeiae TaxID=2478470 RepID=A0A3A9JFL8_9PROT|nr:hypothetical protein [Pseudoroseomonas wenyumeiae]RKK03315.1 hypothetical protein D6Z83_15255 [Pseudoroseomonas wenyumeiae]RMI15417.1 hypothetical protein EBE87_25925 [Pseudoroseomonas wenyumeiae]